MSEANYKLDPQARSLVTQKTLYFEIVFCYNLLMNIESHKNQESLRATFIFPNVEAERGEIEKSLGRIC